MPPPAAGFEICRTATDDTVVAELHDYPWCQGWPLLLAKLDEEPCNRCSLYPGKDSGCIVSSCPITTSDHWDRWFIMSPTGRWVEDK